jgi:flagellin
MHTIANMGFRDDAKTSFATTTANASGVHQVSTLTLSGTYKAGDTISFSVGGEDKTYSVLEEDLTSSSNDTNLASIAAKLLTTAETPMGLADQADVTASGSVLTFTAATAGTEFSTSTATDLVDTGVLKNTRALTILNNTDSNASISELDVAINRINTERAGIGAVVNRLTYAMDNLTNVSQNTSESRSRIMDADYAKASSELARTQIISQAATAMLAQANQQPQTVMKLLQG